MVHSLKVSSQGLSSLSQSRKFNVLLGAYPTHTTSFKNQKKKKNKQTKNKAKNKTNKTKQNKKQRVCIKRSHKRLVVHDVCSIADLISFHSPLLQYPETCLTRGWELQSFDFYLKWSVFQSGHKFFLSVLYDRLKRMIYCKSCAGNYGHQSAVQYNNDDFSFYCYRLFTFLSIFVQFELLL